MRTEEVAIPVAGGERMPALLALPERVPAPAVLVVNDVFGRAAFYENLARRLAQAGYVALDPEYFFREGTLPEPSREHATARAAQLEGARTLDELGAAIDWLRERDEVKGGIGTVGFCMGGTLALDLAASGKKIAATVSYYGFPVRGRGGPPKPPPQPVDLADRMSGRILGHWGDRDEGVGMHNVEALAGKLRSAQVDHTFHIYPGLGHGFLKAFLEEETVAGYEAACLSWRRTLDFYRETLR